VLLYRSRRLGAGAWEMDQASQFSMIGRGLMAIARSYGEPGRITRLETASAALLTAVATISSKAEICLAACWKRGLIGQPYLVALLTTLDHMEHGISGRPLSQHQLPFRAVDIHLLGLVCRPTMRYCRVATRENTSKDPCTEVVCRRPGAASLLQNERASG